MLVDRFLEDAIEVDVDCIADGEIAVIGAIMEHIEQAGIHSGDSACVIPTFSLRQKGARRDRSGDESDGARIECARADECAVRGQRRRCLRARSQSARIAHGAVREQGDRRSAGQTCRQSDDGKNFARARLHEGNRAATFLGERSGLSVSALPGPRHFARPGNEIDRRSDGHRCRSRSRLCQIADGGAAAVAERRKRFHQRER